MDTAPTPRQPAQVPPPVTPGLRGLLTLAVGVVVIAALYYGREVFIPLVLAILLSFVLAPVVSFLRRIHLGRVPSVIIAVLLALGIILGIGAVLGTQVASLATDLPRYQTTVQQKLSGLQEGLLGRANALLQRINHQVHDASQKASAAGTTAASPAGGPTPQAQLVRVQEPDPSPLTLAHNILGPIVEPLTTVGIVLVVVVFLLMQREDLRNRLIRLFGSSDLHRTTVAMDDAASRLGTYFLAQLGMNAAFGVLIGLGLWAIGVPSPILWGVFSALMRFVPYIGAFISGLLPVALAAAVDPGWSMAVWTAALFLIAEPLFGHVIEPLLYGHSTGLSPFAVIVSTLFWGFLWGPVGLILATPFTVCLVVLGRHVESLEFFDVLLGDRPPLTPVENFYQRMLAGDPDEARDIGEAMLKERSLSSYYDEVALKGLQLAANDYARGVVTQAQLENIKLSCQGLVEDFENRPDVEPEVDAKNRNPADVPSLAERTHPKNEAVPGQAPPVEQRPSTWQGDTPVLCIAGRGPLDEAASTILAQLLRKHGLGARVAPYETVSRGRIRDLDLSGVAMICISYLDISGSPAHLRYLLERLHQRAPGIPILVGLWPVGEKVLTDAALGRELGADIYVSSLRDGVEACLRTVQNASGSPAAAA
ncbi:AI-2E family transporter [Methylorubrum populi]|uniref:Membrane protein n=1 Tax=Methylorubrum populi TaxID=223967 RepID=A0A514KJJ3_9HYPH|nr:AI-2E family transporter [Methylorubrum populi]KAB7782801.1 membrane protein [Methylorubrum populi]QDI79201.1 AI-2E family transporter [Methylorubrum populi]